MTVSKKRKKQCDGATRGICKEYFILYYIYLNIYNIIFTPTYLFSFLPNCHLSYCHTQIVCEKHFTLHIFTQYRILVRSIELSLQFTANKVLKRAMSDEPYGQARVSVQNVL